MTTGGGGVQRPPPLLHVRVNAAYPLVFCKITRNHKKESLRVSTTSVADPAGGYPDPTLLISNYFLSILKNL